MYSEKRKEQWRREAADKRAYGIKVLRRYKLMKGCAVCGYNDNWAALEFDHIDPSTKKFNVGYFKGYIKSKNGTKSKQKIKDELFKCEILCCNCHAVKTHTQKEWFKNND